jgi:hypothetical protein
VRILCVLVYIANTFLSVCVYVFIAHHPSWEWATPDRPAGSGLDQPYLTRLFSMFQDGSFGGLNQRTFNPMKIVASGYSAGAQMSSWMIELRARGQLPQGSDVVAGVFLSGGSHMCYQYPPVAVGQCASCQTGGSGFRRRRAQRGGRGGCSTDIVKQGDTPQCDYCCPANYTEKFFSEHPEQYHTHPPCFLAQAEASDINADLCATRNYYETLRAHGVDSQLVLLKKDDASAYCVGNPVNPASQGSPYLDKTPPVGQGFGRGCVDHVSADAAASPLETTPA